MKTKFLQEIGKLFEEKKSNVIILYSEDVKSHVSSSLGSRQSNSLTAMVRSFFPSFLILTVLFYFLLNRFPSSNSSPHPLGTINSMGISLEGGLE